MGKYTSNFERKRNLLLDNALDKFGKWILLELPKVIELSGKPYERGYKHGSETKELIKKVTNMWFSCLSSIPFPDIALKKGQALSLSSKYLPYAMDYAPDLVEECRGISDGANIDFAEIFNLNCFIDILNNIRLQNSIKTWLPQLGCTSFGVSEKTTKSNDNTIIGQNFDLGLDSKVLQEAFIILKAMPEKGPKSICFSIAGMVGCYGINSSGIALVINKLFSTDSRPGVPYCFIVGKILQQERVGDAIGSVINCERASGTHYLLGDKNGDIFGVECTATDYEFLIPLDGVLGHSNHYVSEKLKPFELYDMNPPSSMVRWIRINKYMNDKKGEITIEDCKNWLKDHVNYPLSICRHGSEQGQTLSGTIMLPKEMTVLATYGNPCVQSYIEYHVPK